MNLYIVKNNTFIDANVNVATKIITFIKSFFKRFLKKSKSYNNLLKKERICGIILRNGICKELKYVRV